MNYRGSGQAAQELAEKIGGVAMQCDVADFEACGKHDQNDDRDVWASDILVNNAGIKGRSADEDERGGILEAVLSTNLKGTFHTIRHASRYF